MDTARMIRELEAQQATIGDVIAGLKRLTVGGAMGKRRGRPPSWISAAQPQIPTQPAKQPATAASAPPAANVRKGRVISAAARKRMALAQQKRWAEVRKAAANSAKKLVTKAGKTAAKG